MCIRDSTGIPLNLSNGIYEVTVNNEYGCGVRASFDLSYSDMQANLTSTDESCLANTASCTTNIINGIPPYSYFWNTDQTTSGIENVGTGTYFVTITDAVNCQIVDSITVIDKITPTIINIAQIDNNTTNSILLNPMIESEVAYYEWYFLNDWNSAAQLIGTSENIVITQNGIYRLIVSNEYQCSDIMEITVNSLESLSLIHISEPTRP
mgnify:FL=1